jgi:hypothetical protein
VAFTEMTIFVDELSKYKGQGKGESPPTKLLHRFLARQLAVPLATLKALHYNQSAQSPCNDIELRSWLRINAISVHEVVHVSRYEKIHHKFILL